MNQIQGTRFGAITFENNDIVTFPEGLIGFPELRTFLILAHGENTPFRWLQSIEEPGMAFLTADPCHFIPDYAIDMTDEQAAELGLEIETPTLILTTVSMPGGNPKDMTINLAGPIVVNLAKQSGFQLILDTDEKHLKFRLFEEAVAA